MKFSPPSPAKSRRSARAWGSCSHQCPAGIKRGGGQRSRLAALADDFNLESAVGRCERCGYIAQCQGLPDAVSEGARSDPSDGFAVVPNGLIADRIGIGGRHPEASKPQCPAALLFQGGGRAADEVVFLEIDEASEARFERAVDGPIFPRPRAEALFD